MGLYVRAAMTLWRIGVDLIAREKAPCHSVAILIVAIDSLGEIVLVAKFGGMEPPACRVLDIYVRPIV